MGNYVDIQEHYALGVRLNESLARIASLEAQLEKAEKVIHFTHTQLKSMDGYSLVNGVRFMAKKYFEEKEKK